jgi:hypothetical protein
MSSKRLKMAHHIEGRFGCMCTHMHMCTQNVIYISHWVGEWVWKLLNLIKHAKFLTLDSLFRFPNGQNCRKVRWKINTHVS